MKKLILLLICMIVDLYGMEKTKVKEDNLSAVVISFYFNPKKHTPINQLAPIIDNKLKQSQELNPDTYKQEAFKRLQEIYKRIHESPKAHEEMKEVRKDSELLEIVSEVVNEAIEDYIVEQEMEKKILSNETTDLEKKLRHQRILAYIGAGTTVCTTILGIIATIVVAFNN